MHFVLFKSAYVCVWVCLYLPLYAVIIKQHIAKTACVPVQTHRRECQFPLTLTFSLCVNNMSDVAFLLWLLLKKHWQDRMCSVPHFTLRQWVLRDIVLYTCTLSMVSQGAFESWPSTHMTWNGIKSSALIWSKGCNSPLSCFCPRTCAQIKVAVG